MAPHDTHPEDNNISYRIWVGTIATVVPATLAVVFRFVGRYTSDAGLWWDDYTIAIALVFNWAMAIVRWVQVLWYGFGRHVYFLSQEEAFSYQKSFLAVQILYFSNAICTKTSILLLYHRIFGVVSRFRWALWISAFLVTGYWIGCSIVAIFGCSPVSYFWDKDQPGSCIDEVNFFRWNGVANIFLDFLILLLPLPMLWRMRTSRRQKLVLTGIFLLGGFVCIVSIVRVIAFKVQKRQDPTYTTIDTAAWSSIEQSVGILCACLPTLRPFFRQLYGKYPSDSKREQTPPSSRSAATSPSRDSRPGSSRGVPEFAHLDLYHIHSLPSLLEDRILRRLSEDVPVSERDQQQRESSSMGDLIFDEERGLRRNQTQTGVVCGG